MSTDIPVASLRAATQERQPKMKVALFEGQWVTLSAPIENSPWDVSPSDSAVLTTNARETIALDQPLAAPLLSVSLLLLHLLW